MAQEEVTTQVEWKTPGFILVEDIVKEYPALFAASWELRYTSRVSKLGERTGGKGRNQHSDPTANAALRELPPEAKRRFDAIRQAILQTHKHKDGLIRLKLIDLIYWKRTHTLAEAAHEVSYSKEQAAEIRFEFIQDVKKALGLSDCQGCRHYRKLFPNVLACHYFLDAFNLRVQDLDGCYSKSLEEGPCPYYEEEVV